MSVMNKKMLFEAYVNDSGTLCVRRVDNNKKIDRSTTPMRVYLGDHRASSWEEAEDFFSEKMVSMGG